MIPLCIHLALLDTLNDLFCNDREDAQQHKRAEQARRENAFERINFRQLRACVHKYSRAQQHADLADPEESPRLHLGQTHEQVDHEERYERHEAQGEQVKRTFFLHPLVNLGHARAKLLLHRFTESETRCKKCQRCANRGSKRHHDKANDQTKDCTSSQSHDRRAGKGQSRHRDIKCKKSTDHLQRLLRIQRAKLSLALLDEIQRKESP